MAQTVCFAVPSLIERPAVASGCCATLVEDIIRDDLLAWRGVREVEVDDVGGTVRVTYDPGQIALATLRDSLRAIDYPAEETLEMADAG